MHSPLAAWWTAMNLWEFKSEMGEWYFVLDRSTRGLRVVLLVQFRRSHFVLRAPLHPREQQAIVYISRPISCRLFVPALHFWRNTNCAFFFTVLQLSAMENPTVVYQYSNGHDVNVWKYNEQYTENFSFIHRNMQMDLISMLLNWYALR